MRKTPRHNQNFFKKTWSRNLNSAPPGRAIRPFSCVTVLLEMVIVTVTAVIAVVFYRSLHYDNPLRLLLGSSLFLQDRVMDIAETKLVKADYG